MRAITMRDALRILPGDALDAVDSVGGAVRYEVLQQLGRGGNAVTVLALCTSGPHRGVPFAAKVFLALSKPERLPKFLAERAFLARVDHPAIMRYYGEGTFRERHPFLVAEYLPQTLAETMRAGRLTVPEKASFVVQLLSALTHLASRSPQVVHRDIKPQNIFVKGRSCVLGDFGLMKALPIAADDEDAADFLKQSVGPGMPFFYRTPDLVRYARGEARLTTATDVYQLGLVAAELFTGRNPQVRAEHGDHLSDVALDRIGFIPKRYNNRVRNLVESMLDETPENRPSPDVLIAAWQELFLEAAESFRTLEGRVF